MYIANRDINPGYVGAMHCCKAPLWSSHLDLARFSEPNTAIRAPAPPTAVARRREEGAVGHSLRTGPTHGAVRG